MNLIKRMSLNYDGILLAWAQSKVNVVLSHIYKLRILRIELITLSILF